MINPETRVKARESANAKDRQDNQSEAPKRPSHIAYQVRENGEKSYFNNIGVGFEHKDEKGINVILESVPVDGKVTLRRFEDRLAKLKDGQGSMQLEQEHER
ncbi:hypothetical protein [Ahrensia sp. R2A130]|uniref:hypothetical protein n=1 Tax=Ahrensia sp. R2A130 TaxID=744979 RepID=UPI0001E0C305|nr:hypothetical protein [Ahrensia sp. R2A130]EFL90214.1 conserved hypothetical protein [Ahrensia sp. R2A130]